MTCEIQYLKLKVDKPSRNMTPAFPSMNREVFQPLLDSQRHGGIWSVDTDPVCPEKKARSYHYMVVTLLVWCLSLSLTSIDYFHKRLHVDIAADIGSNVNRTRNLLLSISQSHECGRCWISPWLRWLIIMWYMCSAIAISLELQRRILSLDISSDSIEAEIR